MWDAGSLSGLEPELKWPVPQVKSQCDPQPTVPGRLMKAEQAIAYPRVFPERVCALVFSSETTEWKAWTGEAQGAPYGSALAPRGPSQRAPKDLP